MTELLVFTISSSLFPCVQISDAVYRSLGRHYATHGSCNVGKGVSLEFALFTTIFVSALGVAAFLALTLHVEADRRVWTYCVSQLYCIYIMMSMTSTGSREVWSSSEKRSQCEQWRLGGRG